MTLFRTLQDLFLEEEEEGDLYLVNQRKKRRNARKHVDQKPTSIAVTRTSQCKPRTEELVPLQETEIKTVIMGDSDEAEKTTNRYSSMTASSTVPQLPSGATSSDRPKEPPDG